MSAWGVPPPGLGRRPRVATPAWVRRAHRALLPGTERNKEAPKRVRGASASLPPSLPPGALPVVRRYQGRGRRDLRNPPSQPTPTPCEPKPWIWALPRAPFWVGQLCPWQCPGLAERTPAAPQVLAGAGSGGAWQVRPLLPWVVAGGEDARRIQAVPAPPRPRPLSRACQPSFSGSGRSFRLPYCDLHTGGEGAAGKNASGPFLAGGAFAPAATFLDRDSAAKCEGSNLVAPPSPVSAGPSDRSASSMSRPLGRFAVCGCVICLSVLHTEAGHRKFFLPNFSAWGELAGTQAAELPGFLWFRAQRSPACIGLTPASVWGFS